VRYAWPCVTNGGEHCSILVSEKRTGTPFDSAVVLLQQPLETALILMIHQCSKNAMSSGVIILDAKKPKQ
jgi:hypothetical protein